ncbi:glycosyltransferase family 2 protein [Celeribacter baekdonensis]|uniref:glycosyltransferase family 2 protein n=1 Tax=Celeribacter baekdonensis TaxID=875171 RepID=UPI0015A31F0A|nr:glycosyltransferase family 2 protein [Celeribacter baekdonensis]
MNTLAITCLRDEGPWLLDWLAHHKAAGFTHFLIASHDCTDGSAQMLDALDAAGLITHVPFDPKGEKSVQWQAMKLLSKHKRYRSADLALFFDVDEYLVIQDAGSVAKLMPETADAMPLRWHLFGNNGFGTWDDVPVPERFTMAAPDGITLPLAHFFKTLHRPKAFRDLGVHRPKNPKDQDLPNWVSASGAALPTAFAAAQARINLFGVPHEKERAWLNHYSVRSIEEFVLKSARGLPNHMQKPVGAGYWAERNFNITPDTRITAMRPAAHKLRSEMAAFEPLHQACVAAHRARLKTLMSQRDVVELMWQLTLMGGSTPPGPTQLAAHLARLKALTPEA